MELSNRPADCEAHTHPLTFRCEEGLEYLLWVFYAGTTVADTDLNHVLSLLDGKAKDSIFRGRTHGLHTIAQEIDQNLLNLDPI